MTQTAHAPQQLALELPAAIDEPWRTCLRCASLGHEGLYPLAFFEKMRVTCNPRRRICDGCRSELDADRLLRRSLAQRVRRHAKNAGVSADVYRQRYGLTTENVVAWFKRKWASGVLDCGCEITSMNHGWRDAEIDQLDPRAEPFFPANWQLMCSVHNNSKGRSKPADFAARQRGWELFRESRA